MTNFRSQNVTTLSKNEIRSQNVVADEDTITIEYFHAKNYFEHNEISQSNNGIGMGF